ncbi:MAG: aminotransferase class III-fold pyridoxal phosphate-dependent enzyme [Planctomycetota bacterium]
MALRTPPQKDFLLEKMPPGPPATPSSALSPPGERDFEALYARRVNAKWVRLLSVLGMNVEYDRCRGTVLWTRDGRRILDFLSGYGVYNAGHNHPDIVAALEGEMARPGARTPGGPASSMRAVRSTVSPWGRSP